MNINQDQLYELLRRHFGKDDLTSAQNDVIRSILASNDTLAITDNVSDNSICYMLPAIFADGLILVVSRRPVEHNPESIITWTHLYYSISSGNLQRRLIEVIEGKYKVIYVAPELFQDRTFLFALEKLSISLIVIDDAQCLSQMRYDFNPAHHHLTRAIADMDPQPVILAFANTYREDTQKYIIRQLQMNCDNSVILGNSFPDVALAANIINNGEKRIEALCDMVKALDGQCIIFANHRNAVSNIKTVLEKAGVNADEYHGGVSRDRRYLIEMEFRSKRLKAIVSTNSLIPDVSDCDIKMMIHANMPDNFDRYYDQITHFSRSAKLEKCIILCSSSDRDYHQILIEKGTVSLVDMWNISNVLKNHAKEPIRKSFRSNNGRPKITLQEWLDKHYGRLTIKAQRELDSLKQIYDSLDERYKNPYSLDEYGQYLKSEHWRDFSRKVLEANPYCKVCSAKAEHIHHLHYRNIQREETDDVVALCPKCHCYIHPDNPMTSEIFAGNTKSEDQQYKIFGEEEQDIEQRIFIELDQLILETNINRIRLLSALSEMQSAGMLDILPDCASSARVSVKVSKGEMLSYVEDEIGKAVISWLLESMIQNEEIDINLLRLSDELACSLDSIEHVFLNLSYHKAISYKPHRRIMALILRDLDFGLGEKVFEDIKGERYRSLSMMVDYVHTKFCRERFIKQHIIDKTREKCGKCDNCLSDLAKESVKPGRADNIAINNDGRKAKIVLSDIDMLYATILICAEKTDGLLGRRDMLNMLRGKDTKRIRKYGFDHVEEFGFLSNISKDAILKVIDELLDLGCLQVTSMFFPMIKLTDVGRHKIKRINALSNIHKNSNFKGSDDGGTELDT